MSQVQRNVGWVGKRPFDVHLAPLKSVLRIRREINSPIKSERILSLTNDRGVIPYEEKGAIGNNVSEDISRYSIVHIGDIVMNSMNVIIGSVGLSKYDGALSPVYYVLQPVNKDQMDMRYFAYHFGMPAFYKQLARIGYGILEHRMRIPWINLQNELMFIPPIAQQKAIADYLDRETARIDALIEKKKRMVALFRERRRALITAEVTGELGVTLSDGPFRSAKDLLNAFGRMADIQLGKMLQPAASSAQDLDVPYLRAGHLSLVPDELPRMWASPREVVQYRVETGDILVAEGGDVGRVGFVPLSAAGALIQNSLHRVRPRGGRDRRFLAYVLEAVYLGDWLEVLCNKSTFGHLTVEKLKALRVPDPPVAKQRAIADYLDAESAHIDALVEKTKRMGEMLSEHRQALITAAVTGELEIPAVAA